VDIAKLFLDVAIKNEKRRLANDATGHRQLIKWLKEVEGPVQVICEPSGGYERGLVQALVRGQIKVSLVQANRVRQFARASGILAKTDRIDARVLCAFGAAMRPPTLSASNLEQQQLRELESQRRHLTRLLGMEQNRGARLGESAMRRFNRRLVQQIKKQIEQLDLLVQQHIQRSQELSAKAQKRSLRSAELEHALRHCSWPRCQSLGSSTVAKLQRWWEWRRLIATVENYVANARSTVGVGRYATGFTCAH
jgi:transposase